MASARIVSAIGVLLAALTTPAFAEPSAAPASRPAATNADRLAPFIAAIKKTASASEAMAAYARACAIDSSSVELHDVYMRRMLQFGLPQIAYYPARSLVALDPTNATAWSVLCYMQGKKGEAVDALNSAMRALNNSAGDASLLHNAGQLLAWYDAQVDVPKLPDLTRRLIDKLRDDLAAKDDFAKAYKKVKAAYDDQAKADKDLAKSAEALQAELDRLSQAAMAADRDLRSMYDEIEYRGRLADMLYRQMILSSYYSWPTFTGWRGAGTYTYGAEWPATYEARYRFGIEERAVEGLMVQAGQVRKRVAEIQAEMNRKNAQLADLVKQSQQLSDRAARQFRWDPPAVDGVMTPEIDMVPTAASRVNVPEDPQLASEQQMKMARLYVKHNMADKAETILRNIVSLYPKTPAAQEAKDLLAEMGKKP